LFADKINRLLCDIERTLAVRIRDIQLSSLGNKELDNQYVSVF
jgi:hypothetical protein